MEDDKILDLADELLQSREWTDTNWQRQSIEVASAMYRAATQLRILLRSVQTLESQYAVQLDKCNAAIKERDETRRVWCLYLAANTGLEKEQVANMSGWDCFKESA